MPAPGPGQHPLNRDPLSQQARVKLRQQGVEVDPGVPYLVELAWWGANSDLVELREPFRDALHDQMEVLRFQYPEQGHRLLAGSDLERPVDPRAFAKASAPEAASLLLEALHRRLLESDPSYRALAGPSDPA